MTRFLKGGVYALVYGAMAFALGHYVSEMPAHEAAVRAYWFGAGAATALWFAA